MMIVAQTPATKSTKKRSKHHISLNNRFSHVKIAPIIQKHRMHVKIQTSPISCSENPNILNTNEFSNVLQRQSTLNQDCPTYCPSVLNENINNVYVQQVTTSRTTKSLASNPIIDLRSTEKNTALDEHRIVKQERKPIKRKHTRLCSLITTACILCILAITIGVLVIFLRTPDKTTTTSITSTTACVASCVNGNCAGQNICQCLDGWYGSTCSLPNCTNPCQNGGNCSSPNNCTCATGWTGTTCIIPICSPACENNGSCTAPNVCNCTSSWTGNICQTPICNPTCLNDGNCTAPNTCTCNANMWTGSICQTPVRIFWSFDNTLQDLYNNFNGIGMNSPGYFSPGYNGAGACLWLNKTVNQSVTISSPPFLNMSYTSFTFQVWMYARTLCNNTNCRDNAIFGQYQQNSQDFAMHLVIRYQHAFLGFYNDDATGNTTLYPGQWYHITYIYDYSVFTQFIYVNGYLDTTRSLAGPYKGITGDLTIGTDGVGYPNNFFDGYLDSIAYFSRVKNATEILDDATLVAFLSFDGNSLLDSGPLKINGTGTAYSFTSSGRVNNALTLFSANSYVQITGLLRIGTSNWPYSVAIWINPTSLAGGTIMHLSSRIDGSQPGAWCLPIMGLTSSGHIAINSWNGFNVTLTGPSVALSTWTHVVGTYSPTNGERLYVNNSLINFTSPFNFLAVNVSMTITLGSSLSGTTQCNTGTIKMGRFYGSLDEFYVYARELTASEISALYNV